MAVAAGDVYVRVYDRRMLSTGIITQPHLHISAQAASVCSLLKVGMPVVHVAQVRMLHIGFCPTSVM